MVNKYITSVSNTRVTQPGFLMTYFSFQVTQIDSGCIKVQLY